jgi:hypothetical protein
MLYLVCGTLYNRFILKLSGFDQIPQFSMISLKYHVSASLENLKDILEGFCQGSGGMGRRIAGWRAGANQNRNMNPLSHQWMHGSANQRDPDADAGSPTPKRQRFGLDQEGVSGTREERESIMRPDPDDGSGSDGREEVEDSAATPTMESERVSRLGMV